ncbi:MAG TPA: carbohydrate-binding protein, partial [Blastocatellia bacterium]|nr:carbohydrate-binding protein [Blastocatellia bacterium]
MLRQNRSWQIWLCASLLIIGLPIFQTIDRAAAQGSCRGAWAEGNTYRVGESVTYNGQVYTALVTHTAYVGAGWNPVATPSLWRSGGSCSGG